MDIGQHAVCHRSRHQVGVHTIVAGASGRDAGTVPAITSDATLSFSYCLKKPARTIADRRQKRMW